MRSAKKLVALTLAFTGLFAITASAQQENGHVVLVLPFDNRSGNPSLNWIGDSFPDTLNKRLDSAGFLTISHDDRAFALDHLGLPTGFKPSRATTIKIAQQLDANYVIVGSYNVVNDRISIQAQILTVDALTLSAPVDDSTELARLYDAENAIAWKTAHILDPHFNVAESTFLANPDAVTLSAFENYIRGTNTISPTDRLKYLQSAVSLAPNYAAALLALGKEQYNARDYTAADATLSRVPQSDRLALEANFYLGLSRFNSAKYAAAETAFAFVGSRLPLPEVVNDQAVALARQGKDAAEIFRRASAADPSDEDYHYNLSISLYRRGDTVNALKEADLALKLKPNDNEAGSLRARLSLAASNSRLADNAASFSPVERIRRNYAEASFRQAAFQLDQMRAARMAILPPDKQAAEYVDLGRDYINQGLLPEAEQEFQSAIVADSGNAAAFAGLAQIREASGNAAEARTDAAASLRLKPNVPAFLVMARLALADNDVTAAASDVSAALMLEPSNQPALQLKESLRQRGQQVR